VVLNDFLLDSACEQYARFIDLTVDGGGEFCLTPRVEATSYARCFALFGLHLLQDRDKLGNGADLWAAAIRADLDRVRYERIAAGADLPFDKAYLQLLTFSLSALAILNHLDSDPLADHVLHLLSIDIGSYLGRAGALCGIAQSGNLAMFIAILLIHARDYLGMNTGTQLEQWVELHLKAMNKFGFWGQDCKGMKYLYFQNGYHQYEIFDYLGVDNPMYSIAAENVARLSDFQGHFAPNPGGGGCYDYDAVFILTGSKKIAEQYRSLLIKTAQSILSEQNIDGGFSESHYIRPRSLKNLSMFIKFLVTGYRKGLGAQMESVRNFISLMLPKNNTITTHWSVYSRKWNESDLWDSWFRMLTLARIECALGDKETSNWGFINYPGIGYHNIIRSPM
jgi:hypothetical protein